MLQSWKSKWSIAAKTIVGCNEAAAIFGLTATLMPNQPCDIWNILDTIWPGRFGRSDWKFKQRYSNVSHNGYGWTFKGLNELHAGELQARLASLSSRTTKLDVPHLIPPFDVQYIRVPPKEPKAFASLQESLGTNFRAHKEKVASILLRAGAEKIPHTIEWLVDATAGSSHVAVLTHLREATAQIAAKARFRFPRIPVFRILPR